jgi:flagella synthesis protein FlgN
MVMHEQLDAILQSQQQLLQSIGQILQTELEALLAGDAAQLPDLAMRKIAICAELDHLEQSRARLTGQFEAIHALNRTTATIASEATRPNEIRELAKAVAQANQRNGLVVSALIRNTQGALDILRGISAADAAAGVYGPYGQAPSGHQASKPLASA